MSKTDPKPRRWFQFSLRSVLLLILAVALWLGYEVRVARRLEQTIAAIHALGGSTECEPTGPSLLRLCHVTGYGQRVFRAEVPGSAVEETIPLLRDLPSLREVDVIFDGTFDPTPGWQALRASLTTAAVVAKALGDKEPLDEALVVDERRWKQSVVGRRLAHIGIRIKEKYPQKLLLDWVPNSYGEYLLCAKINYHLVLLSDGTLAELLTYEQMVVSVPGRQECFAALVVTDKCVGLQESVIGSRSGKQRIVVADVDNDGFCDVGFEYTRKGWLGRVNTRRFPGDSRDWLGVYKIERDGFKSLWADDKGP